MPGLEAKTPAIEGWGLLLQGESQLYELLHRLNGVTQSVGLSLIMDAWKALPECLSCI